MSFAAMTHEGNGEQCWCGPTCPVSYPLYSEPVEENGENT